MPDEVRHPLFARFYAWLAPLEDRAGVAERRAELAHGLRGRVLELGVGTGLSFSHYPPEVSQLIGVEPEPTMRAHATRAAAEVALDATIWPRAFGGCHLSRDTGAAIAAAGFDLRDLRHFRIGPTPAAPHIIGTALAPS